MQQHAYMAQQPQRPPSGSAMAHPVRPADPREMKRGQLSPKPAVHQSGQTQDGAARRSQQRRPHVQKPTGPPKRNPQLQEPDPDGFHPRYELNFMQPLVPVEPKLFQYRLNTDDAASKYEFSTVELNQQHPIFVDYNMGMRVDLVDKEKYQLHPTASLAAQVGIEAKAKADPQFTEKMLDELKAKLLSSRDRFVLSNKDTLPEFEPKAEAAPAKEILMMRQQSSMSEVAAREHAAKRLTDEAVVFSG